MARPVPLWLVLLLLLQGLIGTMAFGWTVPSKVEGSDRTGSVGDAALAIASFPRTASLLRAHRVSDHWKEKVMVAYSGRMFACSFKLLGFLLVLAAAIELLVMAFSLIAPGGGCRGGVPCQPPGPWRSRCRARSRSDASGACDGRP